MGAGLWAPLLVRAGQGQDPLPKPIPHGNIGGDFRVFLPGPGAEPSTIFDFHGVSAIAHITGTGKGTDAGSGLTFDADTRFMDGVFVATDGSRQEATFGFV
jgi:hypothetical protein